MNETAPTGHIKVARKAFDPDHGDSFWLEPREFSRWEAWLDVIQLAAFRPRTHHSAYGAIALLRGEFVASLRWLASRWAWTVKRVRTWIAECEKGARIEAHRKTEAGTVYLIVNYDTYQGAGPSKVAPEGTPEGTDGAQQGHKKEAVKASKAEQSTTRQPKWVVALGDLWTRDVGRIALSSIARDCKAHAATYGEDRLVRACSLYIASRKSAGQPPVWKWYVDSQVTWIDRAGTPLDAIDGEMSPTLELLTRPLKGVA